jgi:hypothetical protein
MDKTRRKEIERKLINITEPHYRARVKAMLKAMTDQELSDHYADVKQLAMVYRDNPQIRHLPPHEVMQLPLHQLQIIKKENGKAVLQESKFVVAFPA